MRKKLMALTALAIAFSAPGASAVASHTQFDCGVTDIAEESLTGGTDTFTGVAYGYAVSPVPGEVVDIACYVRVDGTPVTPSSGDGAGTQLDTFARQVTYTAADTQDVDLCAQVTASSHTEDACFETNTTQIPPQEFVDAVLTVSDLLVVVSNSLTGCTTAVNLGTCSSGICIVNTATGRCDGGICIVNAGSCGRGCIAGVNTGSCGRGCITGVNGGTCGRTGLSVHQR